HLAPDCRDGQDQGRQHLLLLRFQGSHSRRGPASRAARRIRRGQDRVEARRQGLAPAPDRIGDRGASGGAAGGKRFHLGEYSHLWPTPRASQEAAPAVAEGLCAILGPAVSGRAACRRNSRRYRDRSAADIRAGCAELDDRVVRLQFPAGGAEAGPPYRAADLRRGQESLTSRQWSDAALYRIRLATSSSITSVVPPPIGQLFRKF